MLAEIRQSTDWPFPHPSGGLTSCPFWASGGFAMYLPSSEMCTPELCCRPSNKHYTLRTYCILILHSLGKAMTSGEEVKKNRDLSLNKYECGCEWECGWTLQCSAESWAMKRLNEHFCLFAIWILNYLCLKIHAFGLCKFSSSGRLKETYSVLQSILYFQNLEDLNLQKRNLHLKITPVWIQSLSCFVFEGVPQTRSVKCQRGTFFRCLLTNTKYSICQ